MKNRRLETRHVDGLDDVRSFFDDQASDYREQHGDERRLLDRRLKLLRDGAGFRPDDAVLEIGCGDGLHLLALAGEFGAGLGVDLSPGMIAAADERLRRTPHEDRVAFSVDEAETLASVGDESYDVVLCVGSLEHMLDQAAVVRSVFRVLRPGGRFVCLTLNGGSLWYRHLAPALGIETRRLDTDRYLGRKALEELLPQAGFEHWRVGHWRFVQRGDLPPATAAILGGLDRLGAGLRIGFLRGGLRAYATRSRG